MAVETGMVTIYTGTAQCEKEIQRYKILGWSSSISHDETLSRILSLFECHQIVQKYRIKSPRILGLYRKYSSHYCTENDDLINFRKTHIRIGLKPCNYSTAREPYKQRRIEITLVYSNPFVLQNNCLWRISQISNCFIRMDQVHCKFWVNHYIFVQWLV